MSAEVPDITVELADRRSILPEATLAGVLAGATLVLVAELGLATTAAVGYPHVFRPPTGGFQWAFQGLFAAAFGATFGLLADDRAVWRYGRGFLGPLVGGLFGVGLWVATTVLFWPAWTAAAAVSLPSVPAWMSLASHVAYGILVGTFANLVGLLRA